jgi:anti-anti-sigma factor
MELTVTGEAGGPLRLALQGRLDAVGADKVDAALNSAIADAQGDSLLDLSGVTFVGSLGIRLLISAARRATRRRQRLVIHSVPPMVAETFSHIALDELIPILPDEAAALAHLGG